VNRSVCVDVFVPDESRQRIIASIRQYRAVCRQMYSACAMAKMASAALQFNDDDFRVVPLAGSEQELLTATFGRNPQRTLTKNDLLPTALSFVWDSARRDVQSRWTAKDPEFTKATRGWLTLNGARCFARFNRIGIGCPAATARPVIANHSVSIKWDHEIGDVQFKLGRLDSNRFYIYKQISEHAAGWKLGTVYINERDGRIVLQISFERPDKCANVSDSRQLCVSFSDDPEKFMLLSGPDGAASSDTISATEAIAWIDELKRIRDKFELRRAAAGNPRRPWGSSTQWRGIQNRLSNNTERRMNGVSCRNHLWTRRIACRAESWRCGIIAVKNVPEALFNRPWNWSQFRAFLEYKITEIGGRIVVE